MDYNINVMREIFNLPLDTLPAAQALAKKKNIQNLLIVGGLGLLVVGAVIGYKIARAQYSSTSVSADGGFRPLHNSTSASEKPLENKFSVKPIIAVKVV